MNSQWTAAAGRKPPGRRAGVVAGEIVEVDGGHIIRSTGRKDRHSKVCTAKGPRDRRVRLSANTAIQFYDVQDRLGYDRPSKAVDWLITKAKSAIDELEKLPPWNPTASAVAGDGPSGDNDGERCNLFPPEMSSDEIPAPEAQFPGYFDPRSQDLRLSLQSFQDPIRIESNRNQAEQEEEFGYENPHPIIGWNLAGAGGYNSGAGGFMFIPPPPQPPPPILLGHGVGQAATHFFTQRGTLQSNNTPLVRACIDGEFSHDHAHHNQGVLVQPMPFPGIGFGSPSGGLSSFHIPARIQGDHQEEHDGNKPSSVASTSRH